MQQLKPIYDITPETLIDYEGKIASIIWFAGCPLRCIYCQNPDMVQGEGCITENEALEFLASRKGWIDGVVLSGGECCMYDGLPSFCEKIKNMGLAIKVDTSGIRPKMALELAKMGLIDTIALDFKAQKDMFETITGVAAFNLFERTLTGLLSINFNFSVRTTVYPEYMDEKMLSRMADELISAGYSGIYTIQKAQTHNHTLANLQESRKEFLTSMVESDARLAFLGF